MKVFIHDSIYYIQLYQGFFYYHVTNPYKLTNFDLLSNIMLHNRINSSHTESSIIRI